VNQDQLLLQRWLDGELSPLEAERFRTRLERDAALSRELDRLVQVGSLLRSWAGQTERRAGGLVASTMVRVRREERRRSQAFTAACLAAVVMLSVSPWSSPELGMPEGISPRTRAAAVERVDAGATSAVVFAVGLSETPVVWLNETSADELEPGPG
jgi:anti-sigma factor RsiW